MFSYYALETWLFTFFALLLLGCIIFYTRRMINILSDIRKADKKVSYKPWDMEKKVASGKVKVPRRFGPIKGLVPVREAAITMKKGKQQQQQQPKIQKSYQTSNRLDAVDGIATIDATLSRSSSIGSGISYETTTTDSALYRDRSSSINDLVRGEGSWITQLMCDQHHNRVTNDLHGHLSSAAVENLSANLPKTITNGNMVNHQVHSQQQQNNSSSSNANVATGTTINKNIKNKVTKEDDDNNNNNNNNNTTTTTTTADTSKTNYKDKMTTGSETILVTPEINNLPFSNIHRDYSPSNRNKLTREKTKLQSTGDESVEVISKTIPVIDESFTSSSTTIDGNNRSTITQTTSKKVTVTQVSKQQRKLENRIKV